MNCYTSCNRCKSPSCITPLHLESQPLTIRHVEALSLDPGGRPPVYPIRIMSAAKKVCRRLLLKFLIVSAWRTIFGGHSRSPELAQVLTLSPLFPQVYFIRGHEQIPQLLRGKQPPHRLVCVGYKIRLVVMSGKGQSSWSVDSSRWRTS